MEAVNGGLGDKEQLRNLEGSSENSEYMAVVLINKEKYEESLFHVLQAYTILQRLDLPQTQEVA